MVWPFALIQPARIKKIKLINNFILNLNLKTSLQEKHKTSILFLCVFLVYLLLRIIAWHNTVLLEDTDSLFLIKSIKAYLSLNLERINALNPDSTPFYTFFGAICSLPGWAVETGARLCSLLFSTLLFVSLFGIAKQTTDRSTSILALFLLCINPFLISLSFSILTEPSYIATVYLGFWCFLSQHKKPTIWKGSLLGIIFAFSFLNRTEGIIFLVVIPFMQGVYLFISKDNTYSIKQFIIWTTSYVICFLILAIPQICHVSYKMNTFAINGRQAWQLLDHNLTDKPHIERIFGLNFSPNHMNIKYARMNYTEVRKQIPQTKTNYKKVIIRCLKNFKFFHQKLIIQLIGIPGLLLFAFGVFAYFKNGRSHELIILMLFIGFNLILPLIHQDYVNPRHIAIILPIVFLFIAIGAFYLSRTLITSKKTFFTAKRVLIIILIMIIVESHSQLVHAIKPPYFNSEYSPVELKKPIKIINEIAKNELQRTPVVISERIYLAYFTNAEPLFFPYANYKTLIRFCDLKRVDFLYLKHSRVKKYPFFNAFLQKEHFAEFRLLYKGLDAKGKVIELYRRNNNGL